MAKIARERFKTYKNVFDEFTLRNLFKLSCQGHFKEPLSPVSIGKESNVFSAKGREKNVILKIYRLENCDFNRMYDYIKYDPRFAYLKKQRRKIIFAWAQREFRNLLNAREAHVSVPLPITFKDNILVLEFIGKEDAAPKLKDCYPKNPKSFFDKVIENMKRLHSIGLVHSDLSEFNILNFNERPVFIDFSQCTVLKNPCFNELLDRDIRNICRFFKMLKLKVDEKDIKEKIIN